MGASQGHGGGHHGHRCHRPCLPSYFLLSRLPPCPPPLFCIATLPSGSQLFAKLFFSPTFRVNVVPCIPLSPLLASLQHPAPHHRLHAEVDLMMAPAHR